MKFQIIPVTPFQQNCSLLWCEKTQKGAVIDPGGDIARIQIAIADRGIEVVTVLLTHGHLDHVGAAAQLANVLKAPIEGPHQADQFWLDGLAHQSQMFGFPPTENFAPTRYLNDGDVIEFGEEKLKVIHTPGHTPGHVVFFHEGEQLAFVGDVLFSGSIGRTDFPQSNHSDLISSITNKLWPLGGKVQFVPGHGPNSTFADERRSNPFVADQVLQSR